MTFCCQKVSRQNYVIWHYICWQNLHNGTLFIIRLNFLLSQILKSTISFSLTPFNYNSKNAIIQTFAQICLKYPLITYMYEYTYSIHIRVKVNRIYWILYLVVFYNTTNPKRTYILYICHKIHEKAGRQAGKQVHFCWGSVLSLHRHLSELPTWQ